MKLKIFNRRQEYEAPADAVAETSFIQASWKLNLLCFVSFDCRFNSEQTNDSEYEQYRPENEQDYVTYNDNPVDEEEDSEFIHTYFEDTNQESFSPCKLFSDFSSVLNTEY